MAICERLQRLFAKERPRYRLVPHTEAFTAEEVAAASHARGREVAKVLVLLDASARFLMVVLPAPDRLDMAATAWLTGRKGLRLATEAEFAPLFPDCEPGAVPPFGLLYDMPFYLDPCLRRSPEIVFPAGNHHEVVVMPYADYERLAQPVGGLYCLHRTSVQTAS